MRCFHIPEPLLEFGHGQFGESPKDGLFLFGPIEDSGGRSEVRLGLAGTTTGLALAREWLKRLSGIIEGKTSEEGEPILWAPSWPGFEACFGAKLPSVPMASIELSRKEIEDSIQKDNKADAVRSTVLLVAQAIREHRQREERQPDVWIVVIPDIVYRYGRPQVALPPKDDRTPSELVSARAAKRFLSDGDLFPATMKDAETYLFSTNFHHQLKAELLEDKVALQLVLESTLQDRRAAKAGGRQRGLQDEATVAWNFATTLYFKMDAKPWALANIRPGVCYVGLVFKKDETPAATGEACCAAQMFLNSGDGLVFRGALGPWYSEKLREFHLSKKAASKLMRSVIDGYKAKHGRPPEELFVHGRHRFTQDEWEGFLEHVPTGTRIVGVRIRTSDDMRLFRPKASTPVLRGTAVQFDDRSGLLWTRGFVGRLRAYQGFETPKPLSVEISRGEGSIEQIMKDVLALTKINYNACDFSSGLPVTLKFADRVGEILMASPAAANAPPLPFRYYI
jgi:hypothetical protein